MNMIPYIIIETLFCTSLIATAFTFFVIEGHVDLEKRFTVIGCSLLFVGIYTAFGVWFKPVFHHLDVIRMEHLFSLGIPGFLYWSIAVLGEKGSINKWVDGTFKVVLACGSILILFLVNRLMFIDQSGVVSVTYLYKVTYFPYMTGIMVLLLILHLVLCFTTRGHEKEIRQYFVLGQVFLTVLFCVDVFQYALHEGRAYWEMHGATAVGGGMYAMSTIIVFSGVMKRVIQRKRALEKRVRGLKDDLSQVKAMGELGRNIGYIAHELKNYLPPISGFADLIKSRTCEERTARYASKIKSSADRLSSFTVDILKYASIRVLEESKREVNMLNLIEKTVLESFKNKKDAFNIESFGNKQDFWVSGDPDKLMNVFENLFQNSFEAGASSIDVSVKSYQKGILCKVEDDGKGCTQEEAKRVFESFYTTKKFGTGLGMSIAQQLIEKHNGSISAYPRYPERETGKGMTIQMIFHASRLTGTDFEKAELNMVLIKKEMDDMSELLEMCRRADIYPDVVENYGKLKKVIPNLPENTLVLGSRKEIKKCLRKYRDSVKAFPLDYKQGIWVIEESSTKEEAGKQVTEDFIIESLRSG